VPLGSKDNRDQKVFQDPKERLVLLVQQDLMDRLDLQDLQVLKVLKDQLANLDSQASRGQLVL